MDIRGMAAVLLLAPLLLAGQQQQTQPPLRTATNLVQISVIAQDKAGHPVADLAKDDFTLKDRGQRQTSNSSP